MTFKNWANMYIYKYANTFSCTQCTHAHKGKLWWLWHHSSKTLGYAKAWRYLSSYKWYVFAHTHRLPHSSLCKQTQQKQKTQHHKHPEPSALGDFAPVGVTVTPQSQPGSQARCEWKCLINVTAIGSSFYDQECFGARWGIAALLGKWLKSDLYFISRTN